MTKKREDETWIELVRRVATEEGVDVPETEAEADWLLWNRTAFPMAEPEYVEEQVRKYLRGEYTCGRCGDPVNEDILLCDDCKTRMQEAMRVPADMTGDRLRQVADLLDIFDEVVKIMLDSDDFTEGREEVAEWVSGDQMQRDLRRWADHIDGE